MGVPCTIFFNFSVGNCSQKLEGKEKSDWEERKWKQ